MSRDIESAAIYALPTPPAVSGDRPESFEEYLTSVGLSFNTVRTYTQRIKTAGEILASMGTTVLEANTFQLAAVSEAIPNKHSMRGQLRCALKHYYTWQDRMDAPLRAIRVPPQPRMVNKALDPDQAKALLATSLGWWPEGGAVLFGLFLALRRTEIAAAEWERFDPVMEWYTVTGKGDKTATIPVHPILRDELGPRRGRGYVFPGRKNVREHTNPATIWTWSKQVAAKAGISRFTTHQLRHTALTTALDNTGNLRSVMEFARHERPDTTAGYTRTTRAQLQEVSAALVY